MNERELHRLISESVKRVLNEGKVGNNARRFAKRTSGGYSDLKPGETVPNEYGFYTTPEDCRRSEQEIYDKANIDADKYNSRVYKYQQPDMYMSLINQHFVSHICSLRPQYEVLLILLLLSP